MKKSNLVLLLALALFVVTGVLLVQYAKLNLGVAMAKQQVEIFESMRFKALNSSPQEAVECLRYVQNYYPTGTKHATGSRLDEIVETSRSNAVREIVRYLQEKTGKDFGSDSAKWNAALEKKN